MLREITNRDIQDAIRTRIRGLVTDPEKQGNLCSAHCEDFGASVSTMNAIVFYIVWTEQRSL